MTVLWDSTQPLPASAIAQILADTKDWSPRTVNTLLARLADKHAVTTSKDGRRYLYAPLVTKQEYTQGSAGTLIDKLFGGRTAPLVAQLAEARGLSDKDIEDIQSILERLKAKGENQ